MWGDPGLSRFDPLSRVIFFDDFDEGLGGWTELIGNYEDSLDSLEENLGHYDVRLESLSHVLQYNKRDLPGASDLAQMRMKLNRYNVPEFTATALNSQGVVPTLKAIVDLVRGEVRKRL